MGPYEISSSPTSRGDLASKIYSLFALGISPQIQFKICKNVLINESLDYWTKGCRDHSFLYIHFEPVVETL